MFSRAGRFFIQKNKLAKFLSVIESRNFISTRSKPEAINIPIPYGHISGELWNGSSSEMPILAIHGWLDNAGTWDTLLPLINSTAPILTIDLPGHGLSSPRPAGSVGSYLENVLILDRVINHFKWEKIILMAHSVGGGLSTMYAGTFPNKVSQIICIDGCSLTTSENKDVPENTVKLLKDILFAEKLMNGAMSKYNYNDIAHKLISSWYGSITLESAKCLLRRGAIKHSDDLYSLSYSPLERTYMHTTYDAVEPYYSRINSQMLLIKALSAPLYGVCSHMTDFINSFKKTCKSFELVGFEGTHHMHLNNPLPVANAINKFLAGHLQDKNDLIDLNDYFKPGFV